MKFINRLLGVVSNEFINECLAKIVQDEEIKRNEIRKEILDEIETLSVKDDQEKIKSILIKMNRDLSLSYEKEKALLQFINMLKV